jgi:hypothetical protein
MTAAVKQLSPPYLRRQADRRQRLSHNCMDLTTARDLRLMAEDYSAETTAIGVSTRRPASGTDSMNTTDNVFDPATTAILDQAFEQAWRDLQSIQHPATEEALARCLTDLVKADREPARLATKAVIRLIVPKESQSTPLPL